VIFPIPVPPDWTSVDLALFAASALILLALLVIGSDRAVRRALLLALYASYVAGSRSRLPDLRAKRPPAEDRMPRALARRGSVLPSAGSME
jgi:hypothetical protein